MSHHESVRRSTAQTVSDGEVKVVDLDATGLLCPLPVLKIRKRMRDIGVGDILCVKADDPAAAIDIPHYCSETGNSLIGQESLDSHLIFRIQKN